jgi:sugar-specific transcriptional regulator TrmB
MTTILTHLRDLGLSPKEAKIYLILTQMGEAKAAAIAHKAGFSRTTVISILDRLSENNYVSTHKYRGTIYYWIESPELIKNVFQNKVKIAEQLSATLKNIYRTEHNFPTAKIFDTQKTIKNFIEKTFLELKPKSIIYTIDAPHQGNYQKVLSDEYYSVILEIKRKKSITTFTLIPNNSFKTISLDKIKAQNIIIKEMPQNISFDASIWFIEDMIVLFSGKPPFVIAIRNPIIYRSLKNIYDFLWQISFKK